MVETNEEIIQKIKDSIHNYFMGYIKPKLNYLFANDYEEQISNNITQFLDAQIDTGNSIITKDDISKILNSILCIETTNSELIQNRILRTLPSSSIITIEDKGAVYIVESFQTPFNGIEEKSYYLYVSGEYYSKNIVDIEQRIKTLEKNFNRQDLKDFEKKYNEDLESKQYELESAKVYESASTQIELKKQKFNQMRQKKIYEYGKKYDEIIAQDISRDDKDYLLNKLLEETKLYDEKNRSSVLRLNSEYENLVKNFEGKVQSSETIKKQMQNLHLFDKTRYFGDMMASAIPELSNLYKQRYLLNSYRLSCNQTILDGKENSIVSILKAAIERIKFGKNPPLLGPHFERAHINRCSNNRCYSL